VARVELLEMHLEFGHWRRRPYHAAHRSGPNRPT
jgi:hypothetical protein